MNIAGGKMTALVGYTGAGKSSIINLLPRFYDCQKGDIKIDGQSIYDISIYDLRKNISIVTQDITLFDDTIKNNILYANQNASDEEVEIVAKNSFSKDFINKLPESVRYYNRREWCSIIWWRKTKNFNSSSYVKKNTYYSSR